MPVERVLPIGAEFISANEVHFRVWAPRRKRVEVAFEGVTGLRTIELEREATGYHSGATKATAGELYHYRLDGGSLPLPDPASRFQPNGPHGPSQIVDPTTFMWTDRSWRGVSLVGQVIYEMHIGTFTREGTWAAAARQLDELATLGITVLEVMPVADFPGRFGWGYDGVDLFAPTRLYGSPDDFRRFVDRAHALHMGVILDVVYNHIGPDGNYLKEFAPAYFTDRHKNEWGEAINYDGPDSAPVREFFISNAGYWIREFHLDGLRLDATQQIFDGSTEHVLTAIGRRVRKAAGGRQTIIVAENETQETKLVRAVDKGGYGLDGLWNDDFHHSAVVAMTGKNPAYYSDYLGHPQEFISSCKWGFLYQGQRYAWQKKRRGRPSLDLSPGKFVTFLENHDQVANSCTCLRTHFQTSPGRYRALAALLLLTPGTPMLFQGQEFGAAAPFFFFADHNPELARLVAKGRKDFLTQFPSMALPDSQAAVPDPHSPQTFEACKLNFGDRELHREHYQLYKDLLKLRRTESAFRTQEPRGFDGAVLSSSAFVLRFFTDNQADRLLIVNLGRDLHLNPAPEPLLAPPDQALWTTLWTSEAMCYGGCGAPPLDTDDNWRIPGESATVLAPESVDR
jgi:maltooligosyltrehalose trehalohydrolase